MRSGWGGVECELGHFVRQQTEQCLAAYRAKPNLIEQDGGIELSNITGGYGKKQLHELVQNAADALTDDCGRISLVLSEDHLYCANDGRPITLVGVETIMASHLSRKRDNEIGRFGLGFKSVLGITDRPEIISRSGSFRFDRAKSERLVREISPHVPHTPVLRIGEPIDPHEAASADRILAELMDWASTVVRLPLKDGIDWLGAALLDFPPEFLLFTPHVREIELRNDISNIRHVWSATRIGHRVTLSSGETANGWQVFRAAHEPSEAARAEAGGITGRESIEVTWAVPDKDRTRIGSFWSYFPTNSQTTLAGIINAPFKTNEDRHDILEGEYNREILLSTLPDLVSSNLAELVNEKDPGSVLDILPARGREARSWADDEINDPIMIAVAQVPCLPDMNGKLLRPTGINLAPEFLSDFNSWKPRWATVEGRPSNWLHGSGESTRERNAKVERLIALSRTKRRSVGEWLRALAQAAGVPGSREAIKLAALVDAHASDHAREMRLGAFVLAADNSLQQPHAGRIFVSDFDSEPGPQFVHPAVTEDAAVVEALRELRIGPMDQLGRLKSQVAQMTSGSPTGHMVERLWRLTRGLRPRDAVETLTAAFGEGAAPVRSMARRVVPLREALLPGVIVPPDGTRDAELTIDTAFHEADIQLLRALGAYSEPQLGKPDGEEWFVEWDQAAREQYCKWSADQGAAVQPGRVRITPGRTYRGLDTLSRLSPEGRRNLTHLILRGHTTPWSVGAGGGAGMPFTNPAVWWLTQHGVLDTAFGPRPVREVLAPVPGFPDELLPVARVSESQARSLGLTSHLTEREWRRILVNPWKYLDQAKLHRLYGFAAAAGAPAPDELGVEVSSKQTLAAPDETYVTLRESDYRLMESAGYPAVVVATREQMTALLNRWGLQDSHGLVNRAVLPTISGETTPLIDRFPGLRAVLGSDPDIELVPCSDIAVEVTMRNAPAEVQAGHTILRDGERTVYFLDSLTDDALLSCLNATLRLELTSALFKKTLEIGERSAKSQLRERVRKEKDEDRKLVMLAGVEAIRNELPKGAVKLAESRRGRRLRDEEIAAMARASKGAGLLKRLLPAIEEKGIVLPQLTGSYQARAAIQDLGLAPEFAGSRTVAPPPRFEVIGPVGLPPLHDYQEAVVENMLAVLRPGGKNRGIVSLPTGSGKTRVAVEAIIKHVTQTDSEPVILWIAQTDELCEQAVDTWSYTWSSAARPGAKLTISRLWGANDTTPAEDGTHLVVTTDAKLLSLSRKREHDWLADADIVLVDEAHTSISKTYTELFNWLKRGARERDRVLIGLSASPYRGHNEEQTRSLINRYDSNLLTAGVLGSDPHAELQRRGILARVRHLELDGMTLTPSKTRRREETEPTHLEDFRIDLEAVAANDQRNRRILSSIEGLPSDMTALVFTASVQHAETLAAVLSDMGIRSASIAGYTQPSERRRVIDRFKAGEIRVLTNYNVLSQGFDAPKVGAVYVARPTFSPNRYQQMIGRGLRGPHNGGSEEVLIVNVKDNIDAFGTKLAFHHFDPLWQDQ
ncbi:DEAD/DEAH box helicase [Nocardia sp. NPDC127526]|uniref:DEAD/DEAH box helicase n=1 Tax=Nocardia sp. NPDC127526 TaxID=3345393 RepID=UPI003628A79B